MTEMTLRVLLIAPSFYTDEAPHLGIRAQSACPPLGLLYIASMLQRNGYSVKVLDMNCALIRTKRQLITYLRRNQPDFIGISTLVRTFKILVDMGRLCKAELPDVPLALGGHFATFNHNRILAKYDCFDFVVRREGEETATELVTELEKRKPNFAKIKGLSYRENGRIRINEDRPLIDDLDSLPFPAYELVSHLPYGNLGELRLTSRNLGGILTSRGCPYKCTYCSCSAFTNATIRWRTPENVIEELNFFGKKFGLTEYMFVDDLFTFDRKRVIKICRLIRKEGLDLEWYCEGRVTHSSETMFREMVRAGCKGIFFGIESCVDRILRYYRKGITYRMVQDSIKKAHRAGLDVVGNFILGAPIETIAEMWETVRKAAKLDIDFASFYVLQIFRGTPIWVKLVQQGLIDDGNRWEDTVSGFEINPEVTLAEGDRLMREFYKLFYSRKSYQLKQIMRWLCVRAHRRKKILLNIRHLRRAIKEIKRTLYLQ